jgi:hypothetical protein
MPIDISQVECVPHWICDLQQSSMTWGCCTLIYKNLKTLHEPWVPAVAFCSLFSLIRFCVGSHLGLAMPLSCSHNNSRQFYPWSLLELTTDSILLVNSKLSLFVWARAMHAWKSSGRCLTTAQLLPLAVQFTLFSILFRLWLYQSHFHSETHTHALSWGTVGAIDPGFRTEN